jgi:hypothetical protein
VGGGEGYDGGEVGSLRRMKLLPGATVVST